MSSQIRAEVKDAQFEYTKEGELSFVVTLFDGDNIVHARNWTCGDGIVSKGRDHCVEYIKRRAIECYAEGRH